MQQNSAKWVIANWKMNPAKPTIALELLQKVGEYCKNQQPSANVVVAPTFLHLSVIQQYLQHNQLDIGISAQNLCAENAEFGAFTGEISAQMLSEIGVQYVIIGHSERRQYYQETEQVLMKKIANALAQNLTIIYCIGETFEQYQNKQTLDILQNQLAILADFQSQFANQNSQLLIAYEPVWAIGTGLTPTVAEITDIHQFIDKTLLAMQLKAPILYGGSVNAKNANEIAQIPLVDGALVGGASLIAESFCQIIDAFSKK